MKCFGRGLLLQRAGKIIRFFEKPLLTFSQNCFIISIVAESCRRGFKMPSDGKKRKKHTIPEMDRMRNQCYEQLVSDILSQKMKVGDFLPGERNLSERYQVPLRAVRSTFTKLMELRILTNVQRKGMRLINMPPESPCMTGKCFAFFTELDEKNPRSRVNPSVSICSWIERRINEQGGTLELINLFQKRKQLPTILENGAYCGAFYIGVSPEDIPVIVNSRIQTVVIDSESSCLDSVCFDNAQIGSCMALHMLECGHQRTAIFNFPQFPWAMERTRMIREEYRKRNMPEPEVVDFQFADQCPISGFRERLELLNPGITGIFCVNDWLAGEFLDEAEKIGIPIPDRYSVIGADDNYEYRSYNLTTVQLLYTELGFAAYERMKEKIRNAPSSEIKQIRVACPLIKRQTTKVIKQ